MGISSKHVAKLRQVVAGQAITGLDNYNTLMKPEKN
jgi:hypothetical protein